jgi:hypothetical protein
MPSMKDLGGHPGSFRRLLAGLTVLIAAVLAVSVGSGSGSSGVSQAQNPDTVPAGFDLFETDPEQTVFRFRNQAAIPANFFAPGSQQFVGDVAFGGAQLKKFRSQDVGDADTVVERKFDALVPSDGSPSKPVHIELVRLSLVSMAPIRVRVGSATQRSTTQLWNIRATLSPTRPSTGQMTIRRNSATFGTFDSSLVVYPKFTFTRVTIRAARSSQSQKKTLDVGALPDQFRPDDASLTFTASGVPWRAGCVEPALAISLNAAFCPGLAPLGHGAEPPGNQITHEHKVLTPHQSTYAQHGIWPVQARLEHFVCYTASTHTSFTPRPKSLLDQFAAQRKTIKLLAPEKLCNPARKANEPFENKKAHLRCYRTETVAPLNRLVLVRNQFGEFRARVGSPERLCLPASKQVIGGQRPQNLFVTEHFKCYRITPLGANYTPRKVTFRDQFQRFRVRVFKPYRLCAPVEKSRKFPVQHMVQHLVCYLVSGPVLHRTVIVRDQFTVKRGDQPANQTSPPDGETLKTNAVREVCIPSLKLRLP